MTRAALLRQLEAAGAAGPLSAADAIAIAIRLVEQDKPRSRCRARRPGCTPDGTDICAACWSSGGGANPWPPETDR